MCRYDSLALSVAKKTVDAGDQPSMFTEAILTVESEGWLIVMNEKMESTNKMTQRIKLRKPPEGKKIVTCKYVFKKKENIPSVKNSRYKVKLVTKAIVR